MGEAAEEELLVASLFEPPLRPRRMTSPAGEYRVGIDYTWDMLTLSSNKFKTFMLTTRTVQSGDTRGYLRFHRFGDQWFLEAVTLDGVAQNLIIGKRERQMMIASKSSGGGPLIAELAIH